jgi:uncharacterized tellurite resistance protein B-like protein
MSRAALLQALTDDQRVALIGAMFAMAAADASLDPQELALIFAHLDTEGLSEANQDHIKTFLLAPPPFEACLATLADAPLHARQGAMIALVDLTWADGVRTSEEDQALAQARAALQIPAPQAEAIERFADELRQLQRRGAGEQAAKEACAGVVGRLYEAGVERDALLLSSGFLYETSLRCL